MSGFPPRLLVLVGDDPEAREVPEAAGRPDVREALEVAGQVRGGLERAGLGVPVLRTVRSLAEVRQALAEVRPVLVVNLVESLRGREAFEPAVAWVLESAGVPFTGSTAATLRACLDKGWTATVLARDGVPIPRTSVWRRDARTFPLPAIVKPLRTDASVGITASSVVRDADALASRARQIQEAFGGEVLVQEFLPGRELNVVLTPTYFRHRHPVLDRAGEGRDELAPRIRPPAAHRGRRCCSEVVLDAAAGLRCRRPAPRPGGHDQKGQ